MILLSATGSVFLLAAAAPLLHRVLGRTTAVVLSLLPAVLFVGGLSMLGHFDENNAMLESVEWVPSLGLALSFRLDGLSLLFSLLITGIGAIVLIYGGGYLRGHDRLGRFYSYTLLFMGAMLGVVLADNLIAMFVFWEMTGVASYLLIGYYNDKEESRKSALQALIVTGGGGLAMLAGLILLGIEGGGYEFSQLLKQGDKFHGNVAYIPALLLILLGAFTKSAQAPFHFWLPGAMAAPAPVSAYLHSATMVKAGVYLLARLTPVLGGCEAWHYLVTLAGSATMIIGAILAYTQTDLKRLLAYSTVSALGTLVMLIGLNTALSIQAAMVFLLVHSLYKGALFLVAGSLDHGTGTRDVRSLGGLIRIMPLTGIAAGLAALSMTGFPPLLGFIGKELMYEAKMQAPYASIPILVLGVTANALTIAVALMVGIRPFIGKADWIPSGAHAAPVSMWIGPIILGTTGLLFGLAPSLISTSLIDPAVQAIRAEHLELHLVLWHGINPVFLLSVATVIVGVLLFILRRKARTLAARIHFPRLLLPGSLYDTAVEKLPEFSVSVARILQSGYLRTYLRVVLTVFIIAMGHALFRLGYVPSASLINDLRFHEAGIVLLMIAATFTVLFSRTRLSALAGLGVVGFGIAVIFTFYGAPDLAITQILVETLTVIIFVLVVYHLPRFTGRSPVKTQVRDAAIALSSGAIVTILTLLAAEIQLFSPVSDYHAEKSVALAFGRNVVNVILVDFRSLDTLGEATVLGVAALGVYALLNLRSDETGGNP